VSAVGVIEFVPARVARIGPMIDGRVTALRVELGQRVETGAPLVTLQSVDVGRARAEHTASLVRLQQAESELTRQRNMAAGGVTSGREVVAAETQRSLASLEIRAAAERLRAVGVSARDIRGGSGGVAGLSLTTPIAGTVLEMNARLGQTVSASDTLFVVGDTEQVWLVLDVYERDLDQVHVGDEVRVQTVAHPGRVFEGHVARLSAVVDRARRVATATVLLPNPDGALRPGMSATGRVLTAAPSTGNDGGLVVTVPHGALQTIDGQALVFVERSPGRYQMRPVERGVETEGDVEILSGLRAGELVVTEGAFVLKSEVLREQMGVND
jgi:cobalt-zinc-cadmium efflux system membrane fusion protein